MKSQGKITSPIALIALCIGIGPEVIAAITVTQTDGLVQRVLTGFVVVFPVIAFLAFLYFWWHRPALLYPPSEYGGEVSPRDIAALYPSKPINQQRLILGQKGGDIGPSKETVQLEMTEMFRDPSGIYLPFLTVMAIWGKEHGLRLPFNALYELLKDEKLKAWPKDWGNTPLKDVYVGSAGKKDA